MKPLLNEITLSDIEKVITLINVVGLTRELTVAEQRTLIKFDTWRRNFAKLKGKELI